MATATATAMATATATAAEDDEGRVGPWEWLPEDVWSLVLSRLPLSDLVRSAAVCKSWRLSAAALTGDGERRSQLPWLLFTGARELFSPSEARLFRFDLPKGMPSRREWDVDVFGIHEDWLAAMPSPLAHVDGEYFYPIFLYHPFSGRHIQLPLIPMFVPQLVDEYSSPPRLKKIVLSCSPQDPACVAAYYRHPIEGIRFCSVAAAAAAAKSEARWEMIPCNGTYYEDIAFYNGSIYVTTRDGDGALSVADNTCSQITGLLPAPPTSGLPPVLERLVRWRYRLRRLRTYSIMVSGGDLLLMCCVPVSYCLDHVPIAIYKANFEIGRWEMVDGLGGRAMFLGPMTCMSVDPSDELVWPGELGGVEGDCIFFLYLPTGIRRFRVSQQSCRTHNVVEQNSPELWPSLFKRRSTCYMLNPKPQLLSVLN